MIIYPFPNKPLFLHVCTPSLLKTLRKGEIALKEQFLLFSQCFLPFWRTFHHCHQLEGSSANSFGLEDYRICCLGRG